MTAAQQRTRITITSIIVVVLVIGFYFWVKAAKKKATTNGMNASLIKMENAVKKQKADTKALEIPLEGVVPPNVIPDIVKIIEENAIPVPVPTGAKVTKTFIVQVRNPYRQSQMLNATFKLAFDNGKAVGWYSNIAGLIAEDVNPALKPITWLEFSPYSKIVMPYWEANQNTIGYE